MSRKIPILLLAFAAAALLAGCRQDMHDQPKFKPLAESDFYSDHRSARPPVDGTVARGHLDDDELLYTGKVNGKDATEFPWPVTSEVMARGRERFDIFCSPCHDRTGGGDGMIVRRGYRRTGKFVTTKMPVRDRFDVARADSMPWGWVVLPPTADTVGAMLRLHGVRVARTTAPAAVSGMECFTADSVVVSRRPFQGHRETRFEGRWTQSAAELPAGALIVSSRQPLGVLAQLLLDPNSDDGFGTWNFYDAAIARPTAQGGGVPVCRLTRAPAVPDRLLP